MQLSIELLVIKNIAKEKFALSVKKGFNSDNSY